jgi:methyl-accepting chemotaxis protein
MLVEAAHAESEEYRALWEKLGRGEQRNGLFKWIAKGGRDVWVRASCHPMHDASGRLRRAIVFATDITQGFVATRSLQAAALAVLDAVEKNDLSKRVAIDGQANEIAAVCAGMNRMLDTICGVIARIGDVSRELLSASADISASTGDLSRRTESQAATLEQTAASMTKIAETVKKNADNAQEANRSAAGALGIAGRGGQVVAEAVQAMARIDESSQRIGDIIGVIDEIARQTNLLALNAAVEAARAGEAGRGFAVVAAEVRTLAQRSAQAAKDIKGLIVNSNGEVRQGVELVNRAGTALHEIVDSIQAVAGVVSDIAHASAEQATGIEHVNKALGHMDQVTHQNSTLVEQNAITAQALAGQASALAAEVGAFRLSDVLQSPAATRAAPRPSHTPAAIASAAPIRKRRASSVRPGVARSMQSALAAAVNDDEWKDF